MNSRVTTILWVALLPLSPMSVLCAEVKPLQCLDPRLEVTLVAAEPDLVTPIGLAIDRQGRLFVVESHTHFPPTNYPGPKHDLIKVFEAGTGSIPKFTTFAEDLRVTMNLVFAPDGQLYATHRNGVLRFEDKDGDGVSDARTTILTMETPGNYPHNGLSGLAFSHDGWLYVGQGENLGERYTLKGADGLELRGGGEGGNVFRCKPDGSHLELYATGFWNPFALAFLGPDFLLAVDNDPDSRPPNRLLDVVRHGDYGFKFRFGRSGLHPFQAWNGELPGTLPMVAGTGEGASGLIPCDQTSLPADYRGAVLVTSWGDHRLEVFRPKPYGASLRADLEVLVQGDASFRPVAIAAAPDGSIYFTDWMDASYPVHRKGRLWRLAPKISATTPVRTSSAFTANASRRRMNQLGDAVSPASMPKLLAALSDSDPFIRSAAMASLSQPSFRSVVERELTSKSPQTRLGAVLALRRAKATNATDVIGKLLADPDENVRLMALIWIGEDTMLAFTNRISAVLSAGRVSPALLRAHGATAQILAKAANLKRDSRAGQEIAAKVRLLDLAEQPDVEQFLNVLKASAAKMPLQLRLDAVRGLAQSTDARAVSALRELAANRKTPTELRGEAVVALAGSGSELTPFFVQLLDDPSAAVQTEAARALRPFASTPRVREALLRKATQLQASRSESALLDQLCFALSIGGTPAEGVAAPVRPASEGEWRKALAAPGDAAAGRRAFFHTAVGCAKCHRVEDHGGQVGPDLSTIARGADREKLMQSILHPSRDIAPQFVSHVVETRDGESITGLMLAQDANGSVTLLTADGRAALIDGAQIASQTQAKVSLMPEGLENALSVQDFRDLLAFLLSRK